MRVCFMLAFLALSCTALAVAIGCGKAPNGVEAPPFSALEKVVSDGGREVSAVVRGPWSPEAAVVLIPDIGAHFRDCNCSGADIGGLERIDHAANNPALLHYWFYGNTLFSAEVDSGKNDLPRAAVERIVAATANFWDKLGRVYWSPSPADIEVLKRHNVGYSVLQRFVVAQNSLEVEGLEVGLDMVSQTILLKVGGAEHIATAPVRNARGREVSVIGVWRSESRQGEGAAFSRTLGTLAVHRPQSDSPAGRLIARETLLAPRVVSAWRAVLVASLPTSRNIGELLDRYEIEVAHGGGVKVGDIAGFKAALSRHYQNCEGCHPKATSAWLSSSHSSAWLRLHAVGSHGRATCLTCHVERSPLLEGFVGLHDDSRMALAAVTCRSCHTEDQKPSLATCETCHNDKTDPKGHYKQKFKMICPGDTVVTGRTKCTLR